MFRIRPMIKRIVPVIGVTAVMTFKVAACEDIFHSLLQDHFHWKMPNLLSGNLIEGKLIFLWYQNNIN